MYALEAAGASLPLPLMKGIVAEYKDMLGITVNYTSTGSGKGLKKFLAKELDFAVSDIRLTEYLKNKKVPEPVVHIPLTIGAVTMVYNVPGVELLKLSPEIIVDMYLGHIKNWNDKRIQDINEKAKLPDLPVTVVFRGNESGTTHLFTEYLSSLSSKWRRKEGVTSKFRTVKGVSVKSNKDVADKVAGLKGAISYVEWNYAKKYELKIAAVKNASGYFMFPSIDSVTLAVTKDSFNSKKLVNSKSKYAYPICGFSYIVVYQGLDRHTTYENAKGIVHFIKWALQEGQLIAGDLEYPTLSSEFMHVVHNDLRSVTYDGIVLY